MPSLAPPDFEWHDLSSTPYTGDRVFSIFTPKSELNMNYPVPPVGVGVPTITWSQSPDYVRTVQSIKMELQGWILRMHQKAGDGRLWFYGREMTPLERVTPYRVTYERRQQFWPTVLLKLWFDQIKDDAGNVTAVRDHSKFRDGQTYPTTFRINHYLSDVPWAKGRFSRLFPLTDSIRWNLQGNQGSFPECLHADVNFPAPTDEPIRSVIFGAGTSATEVGSDFISEHFSATPMQDWEKYQAEITKQDELGHYAYTETVALPPIDDREDFT